MAGEFKSIPFGKLGIIAMPGCEEIGKKIDEYIVSWRKERSHLAGVEGYIKDSYLIKTSFPRFGTGEGKGVIGESIRGCDLFIIVDCFNYSVTHNMYGKEVPTIMYLTHVCLRNQILVQRNPARQRLAFDADVSHWNGEEFLSTDKYLLKKYVHA